MSDISAAFFLALSILLIVGEDRKYYNILAGFVFGIGVMIRPTNVIVAGVIGIYYLLEKRGSNFIYFMSGCTGPLAFLGFQNYYLYGSPFYLGYMDSGVHFKKAIFFKVFFTHSYWMLVIFTPLLLLLSIGGFFLIKRWSLRILFTGTFLSFLVLYSFYDFIGVWWWTRYLLPGITFVIILASVGMTYLIDIIKQPLIKISIILIFVIGINIYYFTFSKNNDVYNFWETEQRYFRIAEFVRVNVEKNAMIVSADLHSGSIKYYEGLKTLRFDKGTDEAFNNLLKRIMENGKPLYLLTERKDDLYARGRIIFHVQQISFLDGCSLYRINQDLKLIN